MALYTHAARTSGTVSGDATWELRSTSTDKLFIVEIGIFMGAATASTFGLGRPAAIGVGPTSPVTVQAFDTGDPAGTGTTVVAWGTTKPTAPTSSIYLRRIGLPNAIGAGVIWTFGERGLIVPVSSSIVIYNLATNGVADIYVTLDE
jgi:hypothetical protein